MLTCLFFKSMIIYGACGQHKELEREWLVCGVGTIPKHIDYKDDKQSTLSTSVTNMDAIMFFDYNWERRYAHLADTKTKSLLLNVTSPRIKACSKCVPSCPCGNTCPQNRNEFCEGLAYVNFCFGCNQYVCRICSFLSWNDRCPHCIKKSLIVEATRLVNEHLLLPLASLVVSYLRSDVQDPHP
jgi:hypothetical protein